MVRRIAMVAVGVGMAVGVGACLEHRRPTVPPVATRPVLTTTRAVTAEGGVYEGNGLRVGWPAGWRREESQDYVVLLKGVGEEREGAVISLDVPELPAHVPGWIPLGPTVNGYLDDLKKQVPGGAAAVKVEELRAPALGDAKARMVRSTWGGSEGGTQETAVVAIHGDNVYILRGRSDLQHEPRTREAMDEMVGSWRWVGGK